MAEITSDMVKVLRERTQAGLLDCKKALTQCEGDIEKAIEYLRKKGIVSAGKKEGRETKEGIIASYIHSNSKIGVMLELNCETDFVARNQDFQSIAKELCMQVAASAPMHISIEDVPSEEVEKEKEIYRAQLKDSGKPENVIEKIVEGKMKKFYSEVCLLEQQYIRDPKVLIGDIIKNKIATYGENISVGRFIRYQIGQ